ncbi:MAG: ubiquinone/menaquinone biosynthesis methyltransferase [Phycisphaerae bacterium]|nr:ubiquinone/menaquinone biosynthesis methyltransferase [Phycisphaerae bacterium]
MDGSTNSGLGGREPASGLVWDEGRLVSPHSTKDKADRVRRMFNAIAPTYEWVNSVASVGRDQSWRQEMVILANPTAEDVLLDVACGTGDVARTFADSPRRPGRIIGIDFAEEMLRRAVHRPIGGGLFAQADALCLPVADGSVSIVTCAFGIRNFQNLSAGLAEMARALGPGGRAVLLEFSVPANVFLRYSYLIYFKWIMPWFATLMSRDRTGAYRYLPRSVVSFLPRQAIRSALEAAGFSQVGVHPRSCGVVCIYVATRNGASPKRNGGA